MPDVWCRRDALSSAVVRLCSTGDAGRVRASAGPPKGNTPGLHRLGGASPLCSRGLGFCSRLTLNKVSFESLFGLIFPRRHKKEKKKDKERERDRKTDKDFSREECEQSSSKKKKSKDKDKEKEKEREREREREREKKSEGEKGDIKVGSDDARAVGVFSECVKPAVPPQVTRDYDEEEQGYDSEKERKYSDDSALSPQSAEGNGTSRPHKVKANGADNDDMDVSD